MSIDSTRNISSLDKKNLTLKGDFTFVLDEDNKNNDILAAFLNKITSMKEDDKILTYKMFNALLLTGIGRNTKNRKEKKLVFDLKNNLLRSILETNHEKDKVNLRYLHSEKPTILVRCKQCNKKLERSIEKNEEMDRTKIKCNKCFRANMEDIIEFSWDFDFGFITAFLMYRKIPHNLARNLIDEKAPRLGVKEEIHFLDHELDVSDLKKFDEISTLNMYHVLKEKILAFKDELPPFLVERL